jgi:hypothetical protein
MQYTTTPSAIDKLTIRLTAKATTEGYTSIVNKLNALKPVTWFNLPYQFNKITSVIREYQLLAVDVDLQDLIDEMGEVSWFGYFKKVDLLVKIVELIESL